MYKLAIIIIIILVILAFFIIAYKMFSKTDESITINSISIKKSEKPTETKGSGRERLTMQYIVEDIDNVKKYPAGNHNNCLKYFNQLINLINENPDDENPDNEKYIVYSELEGTKAKEDMYEQNKRILVNNTVNGYAATNMYRDVVLRSNSDLYIAEFDERHDTRHKYKNIVIDTLKYIMWNRNIIYSKDKGLNYPKHINVIHYHFNKEPKVKELNYSTVINKLNINNDKEHMFKIIDIDVNDINFGENITILSNVNVQDDPVEYRNILLKVIEAYNISHEDIAYLIFNSLANRTMKDINTTEPIQILHEEIYANYKKVLQFIDMIMAYAIHYKNYDFFNTFINELSDSDEDTIEYVLIKYVDYFDDAKNIKEYENAYLYKSVNNNNDYDINNYKDAFTTKVEIIVPQIIKGKLTLISCGISVLDNIIWFKDKELISVTEFDKWVFIAQQWDKKDIYNTSHWYTFPHKFYPEDWNARIGTFIMSFFEYYCPFDEKSQFKSEIDYEISKGIGTSFDAFACKEIIDIPCDGESIPDPRPLIGVLNENKNQSKQALNRSYTRWNNNPRNNNTFSNNTQNNNTLNNDGQSCIYTPTSNTPSINTPSSNSCIYTSSNNSPTFTRTTRKQNNNNRDSWNNTYGNNTYGNNTYGNNNPSGNPRNNPSGNPRNNPRNNTYGNNNPSGNPRNNPRNNTYGNNNPSGNPRNNTYGNNNPRNNTYGNNNPRNNTYGNNNPRNNNPRNNNPTSNTSSSNTPTFTRTPRKHYNNSKK